MSAAAPSWSVLPLDRRPIPASVFEVLGCLAAVAAASLAFVAGWLSINSAVVLTVLLLSALIVLSWIHLGQGRHPVFLFLCTLTLFQGGRLIAFCLGTEPRPLRVVLMGANFDITRNQQALALVCVVLAAVCIYAPSRWSFRPVEPPDALSVQKYLPYLYLVFALTWPLQLFKNYKYYEFVMAHGGYLALFVNHSAVAATVPFLVRAIALIPYPVFIAIFVLEPRKRFLLPMAVLYFASVSVMLALGSRGGIITLVLTLWWITRVKSRKPPRILLILAVLVSLLFAADMVRQSRENADVSAKDFAAIEAIAIEGAPLNMTEMAVRYRQHFHRYSWSYVVSELKNGFIALDNLHYRPGQSLDLDAAVLVYPELVNQGNRVASSYIGEAYIAGGLAGVISFSLAIGCGLAFVYRCSNRAWVLFVVALAFQDILVMPRAQLFDWFSVLTRNLFVIFIIAIGWQLYSVLISIRRTASPITGEPVAGPAA